MNLILNGEPYEHRGEGRLTSLLAELRVEPARVAIMVNDAVIRADRRESLVLQAGDRVELLTLAGGGCR
jgi:thiamine biosynthesis protein ThiS